MSRLIIKNLPKDITESKLREIFGEQGNVTDIQLKYTPDGKFRQFAFIGYHNENEANEAVKRFNNSHINTKKITVQPCSVLGDVQKPKSWSKYASDSQAYKQNHPEPIAPDGKDEIKKVKKTKNKKKDKEIELLEKYKNDPQFEEFLQLHAPKDSQLLLGGTQRKPDDQNSEEESDENEEDPASKVANQKVSDTEYMKSLMKKTGSTEEQLVAKQVDHKDDSKPKAELFTVKLRNLPYTCKKKDLKDFFRPLVPYSLRLPRYVKGIAYAGFKTDKKFKQALLKDRGFMGGKRISVVKFTKKDDTDEKKETDPTKTRWKSQEEALKHEEDVAESGRIFIRNLAYTTTEDDIQEMFSKYGPLTEVNLPVDFTTRKLKGFGVVTFLMPEHAVKAYTELDGSVLHGRMVHLLPGKAKDAPTDQMQPDSTNYKQKKAQKEKAQAGSSHNWNSLFLGHNAVADVIAKTYGTSKETVLNPHGDGSAAVRLALGETQIVATTRKYLEQEGVHLDAFNGTTTKRSKTIILVKNLPNETKPREIRELFEKYGVIGRIIFPPSGITAIVELVEPSEARKAFTNLAYTKFKHLPLYLEWAPEDSLLPSKNNVNQSTDADASKNNESSITTKTFREDAAESSEVNKAAEVQQEEEEDEEEPEPDTTLFVKNLNFQSTDEGLRRHFEACGKVYYATVATKKDPNDPKNKLSMGYGFVRFFHKADVNKALKTLQTSLLDGKTLELKRSERTLQNDLKTKKKSSKATKQTGTKILVRNVPFQANKKEIMELFSTFGEIKALRLPKKMSSGDSSHRGFAFVDYFTTSDAKKAFEALCQSTHLYGRRLVLEWASTEEGIDEIRKRTAEHFHRDEQVRSKKSVLDIEAT